MMPPPAFDKALLLVNDSIKWLNVSVIIFVPSVPLISMYFICKITRIDMTIMYDPINLFDSKLGLSFFNIKLYSNCTYSVSKEGALSATVLFD